MALHGCRVVGYFIRTGPQNLSRIFHAAQAAAHRQRNKNILGGSPDDVMQAIAAVQVGDDVHINKLVSALRVVVLGVRLRVPGHAQALKLDALDTVGPFDVEAGDEANASHFARSLD